MNYAKDYAEKVVAGKIIAGKKVILAAKRYLNDLKKADNDDFEYFYDNERANKVIQFMEILPDIKTMKLMIQNYYQQLKGKNYLM